MVISLLTLHECIGTLHSEKGGNHASILYEMPNQERNEGCQGHYHEEWQASHSRRMPGMWDQDVQNREGIEKRLEYCAYQ